MKTKLCLAVLVGYAAALFLPEQYQSLANEIVRLLSLPSIITDQVILPFLSK